MSVVNVETSKCRALDIASRSQGQAVEIETATERERELGGIIRAYSDVTERLKTAHETLVREVGRLRGELAAKNEELRRSERLAALGEMAAGLAHEVRNPLGGIALYASMLEGELADRPAARQAAGKITHGVRSLDRLVREILDFAQEDRLERHVQTFDVISTAVLDDVRPWATEAGVSVTADGPSCDLQVDCDPHRMRQVLLNLVMNGVQAAGRGGCVRIEARALGTGAGFEVDVMDSGPGIAAEHLDRIFNPFFTTKASGTGLGLAIVHRIVEAHGGTIRAGNRAEGGARFVVRIPGGSVETSKNRNVETNTVGLRSSC